MHYDDKLDPLANVARGMFAIAEQLKRIADTAEKAQAQSTQLVEELRGEENYSGIGVKRGTDL